MLTIYPKICTASQSRFKSSGQLPPQFPTADSFKNSKNISFGDAETHSYYSWSDAFASLRRDGARIVGDTNEQAFTKFYKDLKFKLTAVESEEHLKGKNFDYKVDTNIPLSESKYVKAMSGFVRTKADLIQAGIPDPKSSISDYIVNNMNIQKPKWWDLTTESDFFAIRNMLLETYTFFKRGLVSIGNIRK